MKKDTVSLTDLRKEYLKERNQTLKSACLFFALFLFTYVATGAGVCAYRYTQAYLYIYFSVVSFIAFGFCFVKTAEQVAMLFYYKTKYRIDAKNQTAP